MASQYISATEACEMLGVSPDTFRRIVRDNNLEIISDPRDGRLKLYDRAAIMSLKKQPMDITTRHRVITLSNNKGGVSKTTSAISLAAEAAQNGSRVLLIDAAPQASATLSLLDDEEWSTETNQGILLSWLKGDVIFEDLIKPIRFKDFQIDLIPSGSKNDQIDRSNPLEVVPALREFFEGWDDSPYDYVFIDTDPSFGTLVSMAQVASHFVLVPVQADVLSVDGTIQLTRQLQRARSLTRSPFPALLGFFLTRFDSRRRVCKEALETLRAAYPGYVCETVIPDNVRITESPAMKAPVNLTAPDSKGALAYKALWEEVRDRVERAVTTGA
ncbi:MAG TPA: AAA family ATPase [Blastocatellia bacterium]|nr:AAA family ATPase [Blastocatellia bacterium]